jgi:hypothetical protein
MLGQVARQLAMRSERRAFCVKVDEATLHKGPIGDGSFALLNRLACTTVFP